MEYKQIGDAVLINGDCLEVMLLLIEQGVKVDAVICDPPYGTTACKWDAVIPFDKMWDCLNKLIKEDGAVALFGSEPFSSKLRCSNLEMFKYDWYWLKSKPGNFLNCKNSPLKKIENIMVFSKGTCANGSNHLMNYYPQGLKLVNKKMKNNKRKIISKTTITERPSRRNNSIYNQEYTNYPNNLLEFNNELKPHHPTQKPVALIEYLIKTYTNEGDLVLDFTMGSGTTGVACRNLNRKFIGIELDKGYFDIACKRIEEGK